MKAEIQPQETSRAQAFELWMSSPMPMVTLVKTLDVSRLVKACKKSSIKFTTLMCCCIGTSAMIQTELDCIVNQYTDKFSNPMVMWGKYRKGLLKTTLPVSFQFHHVQMDGGHAARFLQLLQDEIKNTNSK